MPHSPRTIAIFLGMLTSGSHIRSIQEIGSDLHHLWDRFRWELAVSVFDFLDAHTFSQARKNKRYRKSGSSDGEFPAQQLGIGDDPAIILEGLEFLLHNAS